MSTRHHPLAPNPAAVAAADKEFRAVAKALPFDLPSPPQPADDEDAFAYLSRAAALPEIAKAAAEGRAVDEARAALEAERLQAHADLGELKRTMHLEAARSIAKGKAPKATDAQVAALAKARDRYEALSVMVEGSQTWIGYLPLSGQETNYARDAVCELSAKDAARVAVLAALLTADAEARRGLGLRSGNTGTWVAELITGAGGNPGWVRGKSDEDRRYVRNVWQAAARYAETNVAAALRARVEAA